MKNNKFHHVHCVAENDLENHLKHLLVKVEHPHPVVSLSKTTTNTKAYWKRFFKNKVNIALLIIFFSFLAFIFLTKLFYPYSSQKPMIDNPLLISNLPNFNNPIVTKNLPFGDEYQNIKKIANLFPEHQIIIYEKQVLGFINIKYNAYELLYATLSLNGQQVKNFYFPLGTNLNGIDNFVQIINSFFWTIIISFSSLLISLLIGTFIGSIIAFYSEKTTTKISYYFLSSISILPYLIISIFIFTFIKTTNINIILIFSILSSINFIHSSYAAGLEIKSKEFIIADKAAGFSNWNIIILDIFKHNWWNNLLIISDQLSLIFLTLTSLAFFNVNSSTSTLDIGLVFKQIIADINKVDYLACVLILSTIYLLITKSLSIALYISSNVKIYK
ncbi:ABC transporter permease subunit [Mycoplasmopsis hyopharyngis]|uniref:ABC transporter permease subunit n=1 Tax=Mycoplasmopsis hyopharyngis TaxID=29558 RepID=UPI003873557B